MQLILAGDLALVREKYIEVIEHTKDMNIHARWIYGQHPTDTSIQSYIDRQEMYLYMDGKNIAGMTVVTMYQGVDYHEITWSQNLNDDEVASLHILAVTPEYQGKHQTFQPSICMKNLGLRIGESRTFMQRIPVGRIFCIMNCH